MSEMQWASTFVEHPNPESFPTETIVRSGDLFTIDGVECIITAALERSITTRPVTDAD